MNKRLQVKGKVYSITLAVVLALSLVVAGFATQAFAADSQTDVEVTAGNPQINVTVPLKVVASIDATGKMTFPTSDYAKVVNNSGFAVQVDELLVNEAPGFELVGTLGEVEAGKLMVTVEANEANLISLHAFTAGANPGAGWIMDTDNGDILKLGFAGEAEYTDFDEDTQDKVFDIIWTFAAA